MYSTETVKCHVNFRTISNLVLCLHVFMTKIKFQTKTEPRFVFKCWIMDVSIAKFKLSLVIKLWPLRLCHVIVSPMSNQFYLI